MFLRIALLVLCKDAAIGGEELVPDDDRNFFAENRRSRARPHS